MTVPQTILRHAERSRSERADLDELLDVVPVATLATVVRAEPWVVPMLFTRDGDQILLHGSTGAGALRHVAAGAPAALSVIALDGIVAAHNTFQSSANYRSADRLIPGRVGEVGAPTAKQRAATAAVVLPITDGAWTVKIRTGGPSAADEPEPSPALSAWPAVVPLRTVADTPQPAEWIPAGTPLPESGKRLVDTVAAGRLR